MEIGAPHRPPTLNQTEVSLTVNTTSPSAPDERFLTTDELADRWRCSSRQTLATMRSRGRGPRYVRIGGRVLYPWSVVSEYEANGERNPSATAAAA
jgi:hypothetical protein